MRASKAPKALLALLYLALSMAAAWHVHHHEISNPQTVAIHAASETPGDADADGFCALCSWQSLQQHAASETPAAAVFLSLASAPTPSVFDAPAPGFSQAAWARGPPSA